MNNRKKTLALFILDGFGYSDAVENNAIYTANTPLRDRLLADYPNTMVGTSGMAVGLPEGQMGNSEVGHMTLGAGRVIYQSFTRINKAIEDGDFFNNPTYANAIDATIENNKAVHIFGLLSEGGVHSHQDHILAIADMAAKRGAKQVYIHAFLDGRDTPPRSAESSLAKAAAKMETLGVGRVASLCGRFYAMDRDNRWDRIQKAYDMLTLGEAEYTAPDAISGLKAAYQRDENDEFVMPTLICGEGETAATIGDGDAVIFMNFRPDRAREISRAFVSDQFDGFERKVRPELADFVTTTQYASDIKTSCAFPPESTKNSLGEYLSNLGKTQLRIAETEKYAHVTFFFNGGREEPFDGEDRILVPSPKVATYDLKPEMSAYEVTEELVAALESGSYDLIICNYANCDMVGHTGIFDAAVKAVEAVDDCLSQVLDALQKTGGECLITADHGNVEQMFDHSSGQCHTQHTTLPVPLIYYGDRQISLDDGGILADVAPTLLALMDLPQPAEMTGRSLLKNV